MSTPSSSCMSAISSPWGKQLVAAAESQILGGGGCGWGGHRFLGIVLLTDQVLPLTHDLLVIQFQEMDVCNVNVCNVDECNVNLCNRPQRYALVGFSCPSAPLRLYCYTHVFIPYKSYGQGSRGPGGLGHHMVLFRFRQLWGHVPRQPRHAQHEKHTWLCPHMQWHASDTQTFYGFQTQAAQAHQ